MTELVKVENLVKYFPVAAGNVHAVDNVSFSIKEGETLGLVGESGCGKSTTGRLLIRLIEATSGRILYKGRDVSTIKKRELRQIRKEAQIIFQDPFSSLDPRKSIGETIGKPLEIFGMGTKREREEMVDSLMEKVGLSPRLYYKYPHELDGGRRQRVGIARALSLSPEFIVCDEPVSSLDVSIQAQILNLLQELQDKENLTYLFVSHDLSVVKHISDRIAVMYLGKIVEFTASRKLFDNTLHPYSQALLAAIPIPKLDRKRERIILTGGVPSPLNPPPGCRFHTRCSRAIDICRVEEPPLIDVGDDHMVACHRVDSA
ncbi:MAG: ATP-binding cassette domain-containing protein [Synergistaceae bacterium]|nr:ATP-binding cassette domain-containing protein [Synergistota bacterium]NLM72342.1 ATP-binding cassette domain-containing protein [Synergistaceae bacterium]